MHYVPLSNEAIALLNKMKLLSQSSAYVFASSRNPKAPMSSETVNRVLSRNGYGGKLTSHGIRSIIRTYLADQDIEFNTAESVLAHKIKDRLERTYNRLNYLEKRVPVMQIWGDYMTASGWRIDFLEND